MAATSELSDDQHAVLAAVASGARTIAAIVRQVGSARQTVMSRVEELRAFGYVDAVPGSGKRGWSVTVTGTGSAALRQRSGVAIPDQRAPIDLPYAIAALVCLNETRWSHQQVAARRLWDEGAEAVVECEGDYTVVGIFGSARARHARRLTRDFSRSREFGEAGFVVAVDVADRS